MRSCPRACLRCTLSTVLAVLPAQGGQRSRRRHAVHTSVSMPRSVQSAAAILPILALPSAYGGLQPLTLTPCGVTLACKRQSLLPVVYGCLGRGPHGIRGPL